MGLRAEGREREVKLLIRDRQRNLPFLVIGQHQLAGYAPMPSGSSAVLPRAGHRAGRCPGCVESVELVFGHERLVEYGWPRCQLIRSMRRSDGARPLEPGGRITASPRHGCNAADGQSLAASPRSWGWCDQSHLHRVFRAMWRPRRVPAAAADPAPRLRARCRGMPDTESSTSQGNYGAVLCCGNSTFFGPADARGRFLSHCAHLDGQWMAAGRFRVPGHRRCQRGVHAGRLRAVDDFPCPRCWA